MATIDRILAGGQKFRAVFAGLGIGRHATGRRRSRGSAVAAVLVALVLLFGLILAVKAGASSMKILAVRAANSVAASVGLSAGSSKGGGASARVSFGGKRGSGSWSAPGGSGGAEVQAALAASAGFGAPVELTGHPPSPAFFQADAEPEIKVDLFGNIYVTAIQGVPGGTDFWKSIDKGGSFVYLGQPDGAQDHCSPPVIQCVALGGGDDSIDVSSGGYLYVSSLWLGSVTMSASMDGGAGGVLPGQAWTVNPAASLIPGDDRQWIAAYGPQTVYMTYTDIATGAIDFEKSTDAGKTFSAPVQTNSTNLADVEGNLVVDKYNGNLYTAFVQLGSSNNVFINRSKDGGATWQQILAFSGAAGSDNRAVFPMTAVDRGGNVYIAFANCQTGHNGCQVYMAGSADSGDTWSSAHQVSNPSADPGTATAVQPAIVAGSPGHVDVAWLGSAAATPDVCPNAWHVYFAQTQNALAATPSFTQVVAETAIMHDRDICFGGLSCGASPSACNGNRDMLEYFSMALDNDGMANIAYADSVNNCPQATCRTNTWFVKQTSGPSAYAPPAAPAPATFLTNLSVPGSTGTAEPNSWVDSHNCIFGGAIGGPIVMRSQDSGATFTTMPVVVGTGLHGGDFDIITLPQASGARPDQIYTADLGVTTVHIGKSTDGGNTYFQPGTAGTAGEVSVSSDRMWLVADRGVPAGSDHTIYLVDHEFTTEEIRFSALSTSADPMDAGALWSAFASGTTDPELILPPSSTLPNTNPGPDFVNRVTHEILSVFGASTTTTNLAQPPFGKQPNVWDAVGAPPLAAGLPPGPFANHPVFKGVIDSPSTAPAGAITYGSHVAAIFPSGYADSAGNIYVVWALNSSRPNAVQANGAPTHTYDIWLAASHDGGKNFYGPFRVSNGVGTSVFPWIAAGDNGRVDIVWYQTNDVAPPILADPTSVGALTGGPNDMPTGSTWNVMFGQSLNASSREPVFTVTQASDHVIHRGQISIGGLTGSADRSLLDFFEVAIGPDGKANIFNADNDTTGGGTTHINFIRQSGGPLTLVSPNTLTGCLSNNTPTPTPTTPAPTATPTPTPTPKKQTPTPTGTPPTATPTRTGTPPTATPTPSSACSGKVTGGGEINETPSGFGNFGFNVQSQTGGAKGQLEYQNHASNVNVHSVAITSFCVTGNSATFSGTCTKNGAPCTFSVSIQDNGEPGNGVDKFTITVDGGSPEGGTITKGNIQVH